MNYQSPSSKNKAIIILNQFDHLISVSFIFVGVFFFCSFFTLKCSRQDIVTIKGYEFITGVNMKEKVDKGIYPDLFKQDENKSTTESKLQTDNEEVKPNYWAIIAAGAAILGIILSIAMGSKKKYYGVLIFLGIIGIIGLFLLHYFLGDGLKQKQGELFNVFEIEINYGYWGAIGGFCLATIVSFICNIIYKANLHKEIVIEENSE